ncbi:peflin-like isoform X2 [Palaemon carinicauda]|uniref:peflin-like isoform X2 n=1 Tax=Palaemon carinicauda TaxID=392227 RepID=UPI0035B6A167
MSGYGYAQPQGGYPGQAPPSGYGQGYGYGQPQGGYPGHAPPSGYPGQAPPGSYAGQQPQAGYAGQQPQAAYAGQQPQGGYPGQQPQGGYQQPQGGYAGQPGYPGVPQGVDPNVLTWFNAVDQDRSGQINAQELRLALQNGSWSHFSEEACKLMISLFDRDNSGTINVHEFGQLFTFINQWVEVYRRYDRDNSGTIDENELNTALQQMGYRLSPQFVSFLVSKFSPRERKITLDNFIVSNIHIRKLTEAFKARDKEFKGVITIAYEEFIALVLTSLM